MNEFSRYHPVINFMYFSSVIIFSMFLMHPVCLVISLLSSFIYSTLLNGTKSIKFNLLFIIPMMFTASVINPLFSHEGVTILAYFPNGNPLTAESIIYGIAAAIMLGSVICWFSCYNTIMTSDKFVYLFGKIIPSLSLIFSMTLRFIPKFKVQFKIVTNGQKCLGKDISKGTIINRTKNAVRIISIMITWALENAIETADSMKSRGFGLPGRTAYSIYKFDNRDKITLLVLILLIGYILTGIFTGMVSFNYFPSIKPIKWTPYTASIYSAYLLLCLMPVILEITEDIKWKISRSKI